MTAPVSVDDDGLQEIRGLARLVAYMEGPRTTAMEAPEALGTEITQAACPSTGGQSRSSGLSWWRKAGFGDLPRAGGVNHHFGKTTPSRVRLRSARTEFLPVHICGPSRSLPDLASTRQGRQSAVEPSAVALGLGEIGGYSSCTSMGPSSALPRMKSLHRRIRKAGPATSQLRLVERPLSFLFRLITAGNSFSGSRLLGTRKSER